MSKYDTPIEGLLDRPIAFHRAYVSFGVGITGALMLSQSVYWSNRTRHEGRWFHKTQEEWQDETGMTRTELETARKRLVAEGLLEIRKAGIPCKTWYRVNLPKLIEACKQVCRNPANSDAGILQTITETTTETTYTPPTPESEPSTPQKKPVRKSGGASAKPSHRKRDILIDTLMLIESGTLEGIPDRTWSKVAKMKKEIVGAAPGVTPDEIKRRAARYRKIFPNAALTSSALVSHWARCATKPREDSSGMPEKIRNQ